MAVKVLLFPKNSFQSFSVGFHSRSYKDVLIFGDGEGNNCSGDEIFAFQTINSTWMQLCGSGKQLEFGCNFSHWLMQCNRQMDLKYFYLIAFPCCAES